MPEDNGNTLDGDKTFHFYLILNWKTEEVKVRKTEPDKDKLSPYEIPVERNIAVNVPERTKYKTEEEIDIPQGKLTDLVVEEL